MQNARDAERHLSEGVFALSDKYRLKYKKGEEAKYISHLDFVRAIGRTFKRAEIPVKYSQGFNPHIIMTVALPISVGVLSDSEYMDVELTESMNTDELKKRINGKIPMGLEILDVKKVNEGERALSKVMSAKYLVLCESEDAIDGKAIENLLENENITVEKKTKKGISDVDIRPDIISISYLGKDNLSDVFEMHLSAGSSANLKPETVLSAMEKYLGYKVGHTQVKRINMYFENCINIF